MHQKVPVLLLHPPIVPLCYDSILNTPARICCQTDTLVGPERVHRLDKPDGADRDEILLIVRLRVVLFKGLLQETNPPL